MKIQYQDYYNRILTSEMKSLMQQSYLNDVQFVCKDGNVFANCLILGQAFIETTKDPCTGWALKNAPHSAGKSVFSEVYHTFWDFITPNKPILVKNEL